MARMAVFFAALGFFFPLAVLAITQTDASVAASGIFLCSAEIVAIILGIRSWRERAGKVAVLAGGAVLLVVCLNFLLYWHAGNQGKLEFEEKIREYGP
jgi:hypothetical protein